MSNPVRLDIGVSGIDQLQRASAALDKYEESLIRVGKVEQNRAVTDSRGELMRGKDTANIITQAEAYQRLAASVQKEAVAATALSRQTSQIKSALQSQVADVVALDAAHRRYIGTLQAERQISLQSMAASAATSSRYSKQQQAAFAAAAFQSTVIPAGSRDSAAKMEAAIQEASQQQIDKLIATQQMMARQSVSAFLPGGGTAVQTKETLASIDAQYAKTAQLTEMKAHYATVARAAIAEDIKSAMVARESAAAAVQAAQAVKREAAALREETTARVQSNFARERASVSVAEKMAARDAAEKAAALANAYRIQEQYERDLILTKKNSIVASRAAAAEQDKLSAAANRGVRSNKLYHDSLRGVSGALGGLWMTYGQILPLMTGFAVAASSKKIIELSLSFEQLGRTIQGLSTGSGGTEAGFKQMQQDLLSLDSLHGPTDLAESMKVMAKAGVPAADSVKGVADVALLAEAGMISMSDAATMAITVMRTFGKSASDLPAIADTIAYTASSAAMEVGEMGTSFSYTTELATLMKLNLNEVSAAIAILHDKGIRGSKAGMALRTSMLRLAAPTGEAAAMMDLLGISVYNADGSQKSLVETIKAVSESLKGLSAEDTNKAMRALAGERALKGLQELVTAFNEGRLAEKIAEIDEKSKGWLATFRSTIDQAASTKWKELVSDTERLLLAWSTNHGVPEWISSLLTAANTLVDAAAKLEKFRSSGGKDSGYSFVGGLAQFGAAQIEYTRLQEMQMQSLGEEQALLTRIEEKYGAGAAQQFRLKQQGKRNRLSDYGTADTEPSQKTSSGVPSGDQAAAAFQDEEKYVAAVAAGTRKLGAEYSVVMRQMEEDNKNRVRRETADNALLEDMVRAQMITRREASERQAKFETEQAAKETASIQARLALAEKQAKVSVDPALANADVERLRGELATAKELEAIAVKNYEVKKKAAELEERNAISAFADKSRKALESMNERGLDPVDRALSAIDDKYRAYLDLQKEAAALGPDAVKVHKETAEAMEREAAAAKARVISKDVDKQAEKAVKLTADMAYQHLPAYEKGLADINREYDIYLDKLKEVADSLEEDMAREGANRAQIQAQLDFVRGAISEESKLRADALHQYEVETKETSDYIAAYWQDSFSDMRDFTHDVWVSALHGDFDSIGDAFTALLGNMVDEYIAAQMQMLAWGNMSSGGMGSGLLGTALTSLGDWYYGLNGVGAAFTGNYGPVPSAHGGVFTGQSISDLSGGVYSSPTYFGFDQHIAKFASGGVLAEAGRAEAVLPLVDVGGDLGVKSVGGSGDITINVERIVVQTSGGAGGNQDTAAAQRYGSQLAAAFKQEVRALLLDEKRPGGILNPQGHN